MHLPGLPLLAGLSTVPGVLESVFSWEDQSFSHRGYSPADPCLWGEVFAAAALRGWKPNPSPRPLLVLVDSCPWGGCNPCTPLLGNLLESPTWLHGVPMPWTHLR